tara:strand:- start:1426 stop:1713 length:288 start_codon:yes stop_codon:yes gene_type:complete
MLNDDTPCITGLNDRFKNSRNDNKIQSAIIFDSLQNLLIKNCPKSIISTTNISNKVLNNIKIFTKFYKNKANFKKKMVILIILLIFILITSFFFI